MQLPGLSQHKGEGWKNITFLFKYLPDSEPKTNLQWFTLHTSCKARADVFLWTTALQQSYLLCFPQEKKKTNTKGMKPNKSSSRPLVLFHQSHSIRTKSTEEQCAQKGGPCSHCPTAHPCTWPQQCTGREDTCFYLCNFWVVSDISYSSLKRKGNWPTLNSKRSHSLLPRKNFLPIIRNLKPTDD